MAKAKSTSTATVSVAFGLHHEQWKRRARSFTKASLEIDELSTSGEAMECVEELIAAVTVAETPVERDAIISGFCDGVAELLKDHSHGVNAPQTDPAFQRFMNNLLGSRDAS